MARPVSHRTALRAQLTAGAEQQRRLVKAARRQLLWACEAIRLGARWTAVRRLGAAGLAVDLMTYPGEAARWRARVERVDRLLRERVG